MTNACRALPALFATLLAGGCASLPAPQAGDTPAGYREVRDQPHYRVAVRSGEAAWPLPAVFRLPEATVVEGATGPGITPAQAELVANHAARSVCLALSPWMQWTTTEAGGRVVVEVQRIASSNSGLAATSALIDAVVPGPFRLPAGLGALGIDSRIEDPAGTPLLEMRWARGANPLLHRARASAIGDAWELAPSHARDLKDALAGRMMAGQPDAVRNENVAACEQRFGRVSVAGRAASMFVPLSPEAIDPSDDAPAPRPRP